MATTNGKRNSAANGNIGAFFAEWRALATETNDKGKRVTTEWGVRVPSGLRVAAGDVAIVIPARGERIAFTAVTVTERVSSKDQTESIAVEMPDGSLSSRTITYHAWRVVIPTERSDAASLMATGLGRLGF